MGAAPAPRGDTAPGLLPCKAPAQGCSPSPSSTEPGPRAPPGSPQPPHSARSPSLTISSSFRMAREAPKLRAPLLTLLPGALIP